ncbi:putative esterase [Pseudaminobacter salicylatoxidans]|uniref:Putative esterase n=1 Tax=Pseudaminobacter salicylatoxidans TaxID=93369 RepID=A0A316BQ64_PSESE|nr:alpha/beta hydrolase [Pseudaminobacter salicylatoxidans]PWJ75758.1 putative esterase [Pseudaminobacter salicylatoxidans]
MAKKAFISTLTLLAFLGMAGAASARDLSDCERNGSQARLAAAATKVEQQPMAGIPARDCPSPSADARAGTPAEPIVTNKAALPKVPAPTALPAEVGASSVIHTRDFTVLVKQPEKATAETLILLHGSGGDETTLMSLASRIAPRAVLMGVRGRVVQDGKKRWYKRITPTRFDQNDIRGEANAFASFLQGMVKRQKLDLDHTTFLGYSNGANLLAALSVLHPGLVERAILLRPMSVLDKVPQVSLSGTRFLIIAGDTDLTYAPLAPALEAMLRDHGARLDTHTIKANHGLGDEDARIAGEWLTRSTAVSLN